MQLDDSAEPRPAATQSSDAYSADRGPLLAMCIGLIGLALCMWNFLGGRSAWFDEAGIALNITALPFWRLFRSLELSQMAPVGWLVLQRGLYDLTHSVDHGLRLLSLAGGIGTFYYAWRLGGAAANRSAALVALALVALNGVFIQYAVMIKPYILDPLLTLAIVHAGVRAHQTNFARRWLACLLAIGLAATFLSFAALFALATTGLVLFVSALLQRRIATAIRLGLIGCGWLVAFGGTYLLVYRHQGDTIGAMTGTFWLRAFAPLPTSLAALGWYARAFHMLAQYMFGITGPIVLLLALVGTAAVWRRERVTALLLVGPILCALLASAAHAYPFFDRFQYGSAALIAVLAGAGLVAAVQALVPRSQWRTPLVAAVALVLVAHPAARSLARAAQSPPWSFEETKPSLALIAAQRKPQDLLLASQWAEEALVTYAGQLGLKGSYRSIHPEWKPARCALWSIADVRPGQPLWLLSSHKPDVGFDAVLAEARQLGTVRQVRADAGAALFRAQLARPVDRRTLPARCDHLHWDQERRFLGEVARTRGLVRDAGPPFY